MAHGEPYLAIPYCCSEGSRGLSQLVWQPTQKWNPPAVGSGYQIPPGENQRLLCRFHYCCQGEHLSSDSPGIGRIKSGVEQLYPSSQKSRQKGHVEASKFKQPQLISKISLQKKKKKSFIAKLKNAVLKSPMEIWHSANGPDNSAHHLSETPVNSKNIESYPHSLIHHFLPSAFPTTEAPGSGVCGAPHRRMCLNTGCSGSRLFAKAMES